MAAPEFAIVGRVRKAHGVRGEVVVEPLTDAPDAFFASGARVFAGTTTGDLAADRRELTVEGSRPFQAGLLVRFGGIADRDEAERWRDRYLLVPADELPPLGDDEVYIHDLIGLRVVDPGGDPVGEVVATLELPQGLTLEVRRGEGTILIPYRADWITELDLEARRLVLDPPEGLIE